MGSDDTRNEKRIGDGMACESSAAANWTATRRRLPEWSGLKLFPELALGRKNFGPGQWSCIRMPKPGHIITGNLRQ